MFNQIHLLHTTTVLNLIIELKNKDSITENSHNVNKFWKNFQKFPKNEVLHKKSLCDILL